MDGKHPALVGNWKGRDGNKEAAWSGCKTADGYPVEANRYAYHGTHIVGIMVGHDDATGDTIGVAPGAEWIGTQEEDWEFAADPDDNPYTTDDVPDVVCITFGVSTRCSNSGRIWEEIDMTEALGIVNIMSAGNGGGAPFTVESPGNRALDSLTNFAVGAVNHLTSYICWFSARGPSLCDSISIKPNVCAPGMSIRSSVPDGGYDYHGGTSMSTPHVAGAVAILRQCAPNVSVREIKEALLAGCTPGSYPSPNNAYGWGIINIPASINFLKSRSESDIRVVDIDCPQVNVRDTLRVDLTLKNRGAFADGVYMQFGPNTSGITILNHSIYYGPISLSQAKVGEIPFEAIFDDTIYAGAKISIDYTIHGANGYIRSGCFPVQAGRERQRSTYTHKNAILQFTTTNFGSYENFKWGDTTRNCLVEASLMFGTDALHISNNFRDERSRSDDDFWSDASDSVVIKENGFIADHEAECIFDDGKAEKRIGIQVNQNTYSWDEPPNDKYVLIEYVIKNISGRVIDNLLVGLALDWKPWCYFPGFNCMTDFAPEENLGFIYNHDMENDSLWFRGMAVLNEEGINSYQVKTLAIGNYETRPELSDSGKFGSLSSGIIDTMISGGFDLTLLHVPIHGAFCASSGGIGYGIFCDYGR